MTQTDVTPMNVGFSTVTCTLGDWNAAEYSDIFSQQKVNFDERSELAQVVGAAIATVVALLELFSELAQQLLQQQPR